MKTLEYKESGNALFIVLIGVVLFAALSFAVTSTSRTNGSDISKETANIYASEIIAYGKTVKFAVNRLRSSNGCKVTDISFENPAVSGYVHASPARDECKVFHPSGGGLSYREADEKWLDTSNSGNALFKEIAFVNVVVGWSATNEPGGTTGEQDIVMFVPFLKSSVCEELKERLNTPHVGAEGGGATRELYNGDFNYASDFDNAFSPFWHGSQGSVPHASCVGHNGDVHYGTDTYSYYDVLIAR